MKITRFDWDGRDAANLAREIRALQPTLGEVSDEVAEVISAVEAEGDAAVLRFEEKFGGVKPKALRVDDDERKAAAGRVPEDMLHAIRVSIQNVRTFAESEREGGEWGPGGAVPGPMLSATNVPLEAVGAYVPGSATFSYPSTAIMCCVPAATAGVHRIVVATPPSPDGSVDPTVLAACSLAGAMEVFAMGGAQAIAALGLGTESVAPMDVVVGPGNRYVQEAKRQIIGRAGIDGIAGPSELMVVLDRSTDLRWIGLDLCAQAEHTDEGLLVGCAVESGLLDRLERQVEELAGQRPSVKDAALALVVVPSADAAVELADALAPEHLELACEGADVLAQLVRYAGCVFTGPGGGTAFGDYAAGSNHVLPTGGAGRYQGPLSPRTFMRRITTVRISEAGAHELAPTVATLARAEGFPVHAESAEARAEHQGESK
jgi:histidinol dehydrogenase